MSPVVQRLRQEVAAAATRSEALPAIDAFDFDGLSGEETAILMCELADMLEEKPE